ncbi:MAG: hypothetical protein Q9184_002322 [Pyrenodesmia sp. 2 TL-2023]
MNSRSSSRSAQGIDKLDFDNNRRPPSTTDKSDAGGLLRDDESLLSNVVEGVIERDRRKMRRQVTRYLSLVSAILSCLCAGSITAYSLYGPVFQSRLRYTQGQVNAVSTAAELAMYLPVPLFGYLCDRFSPRPLSLFAGIIFGLGYLLAALTFHHGSPKNGGFPPAVMVVSFVGVGMGTSCMYLSAVTTCAKNFGRGKHKGFALAMPIAAFGLSGMWQSQIGSRLLYERAGERKGEVDVYRYFIFLAILLVVVGTIGAFALNVVNEEELIDEAVSELERSGLLEDSQFFQPSTLHDNRNGYGTIDSSDTFSNSAEDDDHNAGLDLQKPRQSSEDARCKTWVLNNETRVFLFDHTMWFLAAGFFAVTGPGEAYINNLGTIINTLYPPASAGPPSSNSPATHVSIVALTSTLARLLTGTLTDLLAPTSSAPLFSEQPAKRFTCSRLVFLLASTVLFSLGQLLLASGLIQTHPFLFPLVSALVGLGYGAVFSLTPIVVSVVWGVQNFGTNWGIVAVVPAAGAALWGAIYAVVIMGDGMEGMEEKGHPGIGILVDVLAGCAMYRKRSGVGPQCASMPPGFMRREVSPLHFQPLHVDPDDILCPGSDAEETSEEHLAKRRRVEDAGHEYLRGKPLYISSARLKGPFPRNWKNPYAGTKSRGGTVERAEARRTTGRQKSRDIPQRRAAPIVADRAEGKPSKQNVSFVAPTVQSDRGRPAEDRDVTAELDPIPEVIDQDPRLVPQPSVVAAATEPPGNDKDLGFAAPSTYLDREWLKTSRVFAKGKPQARDNAKSPTPTPAPRARNEVSGQASPAPRKESSDLLALSLRSGLSKQPSPVPRRDSYTQSASVVSGASERLTKRLHPANKIGKEILRTERIPAKPHGVLRPGSPSLESSLIVKEVDFNGLDPGNMEAYKEAKQLSQQAIERAQHDWQAHVEAKRLAENAALRAMTSSPAHGEAASHVPEADTKAAEAIYKNTRLSTREVPPSTNLPAFEYRPRKASQSPKRTSFREDLEAAKKKARAEEKRRLSFTASGRVKERRPQPSLCESQSNLSHDKPLVKPTHQGVSDDSSAASKKRSDVVTDLEDSSHRIASLPEAQIVQPPGLAGGHSTEMLETEKLSLKFPSTDEGDSYLDLSTQAAMRKAQQSFDSVVAATSPFADRHGESGNDAVNANRGTPLQQARCKGPISTPTRGFLTPAVDDQEPISTQAMMDAISPFAMTTVKKPLRERESDSVGSAVRSSTSQSPASHDFRAASLSMSTTPSQSPAPADNDPPIPLSTLSKPASTITSFSIAPNGTMTEVLEYDGQQQPDYHMDDSDLNAVLEEAGSFLGDWSVEKETRCLQRSAAESNVS